MQISFERSGGFTGIPMRATVDTASLPSAEANHLRSLIESANFFRLPSAVAPSAQPDRFQYQLTVAENNREHTVTMGESTVPGTLRPLLDWLMETARGSR
ncbi:MAG: hypothetical protein HC866_02105 [Leptolyngbyaceae cyanobacterium RU_5_1]|nr:hypothetical protein [Leptolyngbyaceae cyanobacterium RU_5_1]